jgi:hypothetical protein
MVEHGVDIAFENPSVDIERGGWGRDFQASVLGAPVTGRVFFNFEGRSQRDYAAQVIFDRDDEVPIVPALVQESDSVLDIEKIIKDDQAAAILVRSAMQRYFAA